MMIEKAVEITVLDKMATKATVKEYRADEDIYVFDLRQNEVLIAKDRYAKKADAPFELNEAEFNELTYVPEIEEPEEI